MLTISGNPVELQRAHEMTIEAFESIRPKRFEATRVGFPGGNLTGPALWSESLGIWAMFRRFDDSKYRKYWHAFGTERLDHGQVSITCEINFPLSGLSAKYQGGVAKDEAGNFYLTHAGRSGGMRGRSATLFRHCYDREMEVVRSGMRERLVAQFGPIDSSEFPAQISNFVQTMALVKSMAPHRNGVGQGFQSDIRARLAVERYAEGIAREHYESQHFTVKRVGAPYDLLCTKGDQMIHVEVKGTQGTADQVLVTVGEVMSARSKASELFVVSGIAVSNAYRCTGGRTLVIAPWYPADSDLRPITYRYSVPIGNELRKAAMAGTNGVLKS